jgi:phage shock protein PspC (stress-responsive transcriptional regulator)
MIAGVAAGLANYFGIDPVLIRIIFVITVLSGGWGILVYVAFWLLVPEAKTSSERLQMQGKPVTVDSLKEIVERADVQGVAHRASSSGVRVINSIFRVALKTIGILIILTGLSMLFGLIGAGTYTALHQGHIFQENFYPVGASEQLLIAIGFAASLLISLLVIVLGMAMVRRKWPVAPWATGVIAGLLFVCLASGIALGADVAPRVRDRFEASQHTHIQTLQPFTSLDTKGNIPVDIEQGGSYSVTYTYIGNPNLANIKVSNKNGNLTVDSTNFTSRTDCNVICMFPTYDMQIIVTTPKPEQLTPQDANQPVDAATPAMLNEN